MDITVSSCEFVCVHRFKNGTLFLGHLRVYLVLPLKTELEELHFNSCMN